jgi:hypothetical protein
MQIRRLRKTAGNIRFGNMAGDEYLLNILFAIRVQFQVAIKEKSESL